MGEAIKFWIAKVIVDLGVIAVVGLGAVLFIVALIHHWERGNKQ